MCDALREFFKDELQDSNAKGKSEAIIEFLEEKGEVTEELCKAIYAQKDHEMLKKWIKLAARAESIDDFETAIGLVK